MFRHHHVEHDSNSPNAGGSGTGAGAGAGAGAGGASQNLKQKKTSQRPTLSCTECARRKTKCDKVVPCGPCQKRGKSHLCRVESNILSKDKRTSVDASSAPPPIVDPEAARHAAYNELDTLRQTTDLLRSRIAGLEGLLATAFAANQIKPSLTPPSSQSSSSYNSYPHPSSATFYPPPPPPLASQHPQNQSHAVAGPSSSRSLPAPPAPPPVPKSEASEDISAPGTSTGDETLRGEEVEASVALEFMALGRHRAFGHPGDQQALDSETNGDGGGGPGGETSQQTSPHAREEYVPTPTDAGSSGPAAPFLPSPSALFPTTASLLAAAPPRSRADALISHSLDWMGWHHGAVHAPSFKRETLEFWNWGERRMEVASPAWLALWYALLVVGVGNLAEGQGQLLGIMEDERSYLARTWFDCSLSCLYMANFLQNHSVYAVQAIAVLVVTGQDASTANLIPTLLTTAISICQDMGMHRMSSDLDWEASTRGLSQPARVKSLIARETRKRVFWALTSQDWFGIPYRRTYIVQPTQVTTPLPANAHDEDLLSGQLINRPPEQYTVVSKLLLWIQIARCLQEIFEHMDRNANPSYTFLLEVDSRLSSIIDNCPRWLHENGPSVGMPPSANWVRNAFFISSNHKVLTLHRPFLHLAFRDSRFESSRRRAIAASRNILREAARFSDSRLWTIPYHTSAAACVALLDIFQRNSMDSPDLDEQRREVLGALSALERMQDTSSIARRAVALISNLVAEESRVREERSKVLASKPRSKKRSLEEGGGDYTKAAKKMSLNEISPGASGSPSATTPSTTDSTHPSPALHNSASLYPPPTFNYKWEPQHPNSLPPPPPSHNGGPPPPPVGIDPVPFDFGAGVDGSGGQLPQEFLSVFLESEFDPLHGAITDGIEGMTGGGGAYDPFSTVGSFGFGTSVPGSWTL
ncbi:hypothetical protein T439DRAFT_347217 [Meredithblackwellia eburnea MCA 4105]